MMFDIKPYLFTHYLLNFFAVSVYLISRSIEPVCRKLFEDNEDGECTFDWRDTDIIMFACFVVVVKNRRWKPLSNKEYLSNMFLFGKCATALLFFRRDARWAFLYLIFCLIIFLGCPEPSYKGPNNVTFFRGQALDEELYHTPSKIRLVEFYAGWSPQCARFSSVFAKLSMAYTNDFLEFGKLDVTRYPKIADKYKVDHSVSSKALPTLILFESGKEKMRKPVADGNGRVLAAYIFKEENIIRDFNLNELYKKTKGMKVKNVTNKKE